MKTTGHLAYLDRGNGPAVVLLHDTLMAPDGWQSQASALAKAGFRVIIPDLSSFSDCENLEAFGHSLIDLLDRLGIGRFAVCGVGLGGAIILSLLENYSQRIAGACFINTRAGSDDVHEKLRRAEMLSLLKQGDDLCAREDLLRMLFGGREKYLTHAIRQRVKQTVVDYDRRALMTNLKVLQTRKNYMALLPEIDLPTMVMYGRQDLICHPGYSRLMVSSLSNCLGEVGLEGGHLVHLEQPAAVTAALIDFLQAIVPRRAKAKCARRLMAA